MQKKDLFRDYTKYKPLTAKELHELIKITDLKNKLVKQLEAGIESVRENLKHFLLNTIKSKRKDLYDLMNDKYKEYDREIDKTIDLEKGIYTK